jgi:hypothetical protein
MVDIPFLLWIREEGRPSGRGQWSKANFACIGFSEVELLLYGVLRSLRAQQRLDGAALVHRAVALRHLLKFHRRTPHKGNSRKFIYRMLHNPTPIRAGKSLFLRPGT